MSVWKTWSFGTLDAGITTLYGVGGTPPGDVFESLPHATAHDARPRRMTSRTSFM